MNKHIDKSLEELKNLPRSEAKTKQKIQSNALRSQLRLNLDKVFPPFDKNQMRSQTSQILSKQSQPHQMPKHIKTKSSITQNRMSPTPQPIPIEIFSQTNSAVHNSPG